MSFESGAADDVPDVSTSGPSADSLSEEEKQDAQSEVFQRIVQGRSHSETVMLETPYGELECTIDLSALDRETRWDCLKSLPDGMFQAASEEDVDESDITLSSSTIPGGEGISMMELILTEALSADKLSPHQFETLISEDLSDEVVIQLGMRILEMSFEQGQVSGFRFE